jgi:transcription-repair coupling factor (superfamily II helicase)
MVSSKLEAILELLSRKSDSVRIRGASQSALAYLIAQICEADAKFLATPRRKVVICPNDDVAIEFCADLEALSSVLSKQKLNACHFPNWEQSPYSSIAPSIRTRHARIGILSALTQPTGPEVIVTTFAASIQAALPQLLCGQLTLTLQVNHKTESHLQLAALLNERGYQRVDLVEDPGTFSIRGDIFDLFAPHSPRPVRVEFFGDEIERIREFDPKSQRTINGVENELTEFRIPPAREVLINSTTAATLRRKLKSHADDLGIPRSVRDPILSAIQEGTYPDHSDTWVPFVYSDPSTLWDYVSQSANFGNPLVIWNDEFQCEQNWTEFYKEQIQLSNDPDKNSKILPELKELYPEPERWLRILKQKQNLFLDQLELLKTETDPQNIHNFDLQIQFNPRNSQKYFLANIESSLKTCIKSGYKIAIFASTQTQLERFRLLFEEKGISSRANSSIQSSALSLAVGNLSGGFDWTTEGILILTEEEIFNRKETRKKKISPPQAAPSNSQEWSEVQALSDLVTGDYIVHRDHGIGQYQGLVRLTLSGAPSDFIQLEYAGKDRLYLPIYRLNLVQKYVGAGGKATLDRLGSQQFAVAKEKARDSAKKLAINLLQLYAERKMRPGIQFSPPDSDYNEFEAKFPFEETPDQAKAIQNVLSDLESGRMMDRLICGDVGYGKTEVAIRAAFRAVSEGKQVIVLVPTTILALQHEQTFKNRIKDYPIVIESITRFKTSKAQKEILKSLESGQIDIIVGTHRLLSRDVHLKDLGLLIIDEEHRFGVEHKERLKTFKLNTHVLTLTATPIPRTLHMSLSGLRDITLINTPPIDRLPIRTFVSKYDESIVKKAIEFELARGGQVFFLHNRVQNIEKVANRIKELVPLARVITAHGQMEENQLEKRIASFYQKSVDVLVTTTIIESGLDLPSANTILITRADALGLAQLYQVRGRVGRGQQRGYAYLFIPEEGLLSQDALRRLEVIQKFVELGSGFNIASHDLEIRGGGDLLGPQQSGNIGAVGFDLYMELLDEAIQELQNQKQVDEPNQKEPEIRTPYAAFFSEDYVPDVRQRLSLYRRFSSSRQESEIDSLEEEMRDRFGALPTEAQNLIWLIRVKHQLKKMGIESLTVGSNKISLLPGKTSLFDPVRTIALLSADPKRYQITPDSKLIVQLATFSIQDLFFALERLARDFSSSSS